MTVKGMRAERQQAVGVWLLVLAAMVLVNVVLGGLTRLTGSGLSMVEWQPLTVLPPLSDAGWQDLFGKYQESPQYRMVNAGMTLAGFKGIFWLEYGHRLWGRLIGFAFLLPFLAFVVRGRIGRAEIPRFALLFLLGGGQGVLGWAMVKSGLVDRPEVSHYRLAAHLLAALILFAALLWTAFDRLPRSTAGGELAVARRLRRRLGLLLGLLSATIAAGALVAGLHAGLVYNTFPLMGDTLLPAEAFELSPMWLNPLENLVTVQFDHRLLAMLSWAVAVSLLLSGWRRLPQPSRLPLVAVPAAATVQAALGVSTLLLVVPVPLAVIHQAGAFIVFGTALWALHRLRDSSSSAN